MDRRPQPGEIPAPLLPEPDDDLHVIHYSQERAEDCVAATPAVSAIVVQHFLTGEQRSFSAMRAAERDGLSPSEWPARLEELERRLLEEFFAFAAGLPRANWLHWGMRTPRFGFEVLQQRARRHGLEPVEMPAGRGFDLANFLKRRYGRDFAPHPRFWHASHHNGVAAPGFLNDVQSAAAWAAGHHAALLRSLLYKVGAIARLYELARAGEFKVVGNEAASLDALDYADPNRGAQDGESRRIEPGVSAPSVAQIIDVLRRTGRRGKALPATLVEFMADRDSAPVEEVAERVHGFSGADCRRIYVNVSRTNKELERLASDFRFKVSAGHVHKIAAGSAGAQLPICNRNVA